MLAETNEPANNAMKLESGTWEGINNAYWHYNILSISESGQHKFWVANISNAFRIIKHYDFSNDDITCNSRFCSIIINEDDERESFINLVLTKTNLNTFKVIDIRGDKNNPRLLADNYDLKQQQKDSVVRQFMKQFRNKTKELFYPQTTGFKGFWIGTIQRENTTRLLTLSITKDSEATFTTYTSGLSGNFKATFSAESLNESVDNLLIKPTGDIHLKQVHISYISNDWLYGNSLSELSKGMMPSGEFKLNKVDWGN